MRGKKRQYLSTCRLDCVAADARASKEAMEATHTSTVLRTQAIYQPPFSFAFLALSFFSSFDCGVGTLHIDTYK